MKIRYPELYHSNPSIGLTIIFPDIGLKTFRLKQVSRFEERFIMGLKGVTVSQI